LAAGRVLGESIAVAMVIGNRPAIPHSLLEPGATLGSAMVNQFAEATPGLGTSSVIALGAVLLMLTVLVNVGGQCILNRPGGGDQGPLPRGPATIAVHQAGAEAPRAGIQPQVQKRLVAERSASTLPRRRFAGRSVEVLCGVCVAISLAPVIGLLYYTIVKGAPILSLSFLTHPPRPVGVPGGGISTAITGSARIAGLALAMAVPVGVLAALFLYERPGRVAGAVRFSAAVLTGVPSIVIGIFAYAVIVHPLHHFSNVAASFALAALMVPIMVRANEEALRTVPVDLWEAGMALGSRRSRVARLVILRHALPGVLSGNLLALARGVGETAPLLFTAAAPTAAITLLIFSNVTQPFSPAQQAAWGTALILLTAVLLLSAATRLLSWALTRNTR
jgi:phosphate transport system permease protein